jgi:hypothetical protein
MIVLCDKVYGQLHASIDIFALFTISVGLFINAITSPRQIRRTEHKLMSDSRLTNYKPRISVLFASDLVLVHAGTPCSIIVRISAVSDE